MSSTRLSLLCSLVALLACSKAPPASAPTDDAGVDAATIADTEAEASAPLVWPCPPGASTLACPPRVEPSACSIDSSGNPPPFCPPRCEAPIEPVDCPIPTTPEKIKVLLFTRFMPGSMGGWDAHPSHCIMEKNLVECGRARGWTVVQTRDPSIFANLAELSTFDVVAFAITNHEVLDSDLQKAGLQAFVRSGKGFAGLHSSSATFIGPSGYTWPWYGALLGGSIFAGHGPTLTTNPLHHAKSDPLLDGVPDPWVRCEENYNHHPNPADNPDLEILLWMDETCPGFPPSLSSGGRHPLSWRHHFEGGRVFYTALGHTNQSYYDKVFLDHVGKAIAWTAGK